jgi:NitT/TauT family transport system substrate-binding protein
LNDDYSQACSLSTRRPAAVLCTIAAVATLRGVAARMLGMGVLLASACAPAAPAPSAPPTSPPPTSAAEAASKPAPTVAAAPTSAPAPPTPAPTPTAAPLTKLNVSHPEGGGHLPLFYARDKGIFAAHGLEVTLLPLGGGPPAAAALQADETQIADITGSEIVSSDAQGADLIVIGTLVPVYPYVFEVSQDITSVEALKGKTIAVRATGDATDVATRVTLRKLGLDPDSDVTILAVQQEGARMAALRSGQICCSVAQPQDQLLLEPVGFHPLFDLAALGLPNSQGALAVKRSFATANHDALQRFMDALVEAIGKAKQDRAGALPVLKKQLKLEDDRVVEVTYDYFMGKVVPSVPVPAADQFSESIELLAQNNDKVKGFSIDRYIEPSFVEQAAKR